MPFQSVPDTIELTIRGLVALQQNITTFYARKDGGYDETDVANLATIGDTWAGTYWVPLVGAHYTYLEAHTRGLANALDFEAGGSGHTGVGTHSGEGLPSNVSLSVKRQSVFTGRAARGRIFMPGMTLDMLDSVDTASPAYATAVIAAMYALNTALDGGGFTPVIVHRRAAGTLLVPALTYEIVTWNIVDYVLDSQRRRLPGRGV